MQCKLAEDLAPVLILHVIGLKSVNFCFSSSYSQILCPDVKFTKLGYMPHS